MSRSSPLLVAALALIASGLGVLAWRQQAEIARLTATLERRSAGNLSTSARAASPSPGSTLSRAKAVPVGRPSPDALLGAREEDNGPLASALARAPHRPTGIARLMSDPEFVRAFSLHQEGALDTRFAALFRQLNLSADELAAFKRLLVEKENVALDVVAISQEDPGGPLPAAELNASISAAQTQVESAIQQSLGRDRYAVYREFERTIAQRAMVSRLEQRLSYTPTPLQPAQAEAVVKILARDVPAETAPSRPAIAVLAGGGAAEGTPIVHATPAAAHVTEEVLAQTQAVLSPPQVNALRQIQVEMGAGAQAARIFNATVPGISLPTDDNAPGLRVLTQ